jgi:hypothetical protein
MYSHEMYIFSKGGIGMVIGQDQKPVHGHIRRCNSKIVHKFIGFRVNGMFLLSVHLNNNSAINNYIYGF